MPRHVSQILPVLLLAILFERCAQVVPLGGGKRDTNPPKLQEAVPANKSVSFKSSEIELRFDEFVQLRDLNNQLIITPRLKTTPDITADGKKIRIVIKPGELAPFTTYRFFFGAAIADMHESNALNDFEYIFSTGPYIDSLKLSGTITEAFNNSASPGVLVGLYTGHPSDSLPYNQTPDYIARSGADGKYTFSNLPVKTFAVYAFTDRNKNYLYDGDAEKIAFPVSALGLRSDSVLDLKLFQEESPKIFIKRSASPYYGYGEIVLNRKSKVKLSAIDRADEINIFEKAKGREKDTVSFYYRKITDTLALSLENISASKTDTLKILLPRAGSASKKVKNYSLNTVGGKLGLNTKLRLTFPLWMDTSWKQLSRLRLTSKEDSAISTLPVQGSWISITELELSNQLKEGVAYVLRADTLAFKDINGANNDSLVFNFKTSAGTDFGKLTLKLKVNKKQNYIAQLINDQQKIFAERHLSFSLSSSNAVTIDFTDIPPGNYSFKLVYDANANKKWDTGNALLKKQPEQVFISPKQLKVLADWEVEEEITVKE